MHRLLGAPTVRWLPAKATIETEVLLFLVRSPEAARQVADVRRAGNGVAIDWTSER
jgi:hypothetical protein